MGEERKNFMEERLVDWLRADGHRLEALHLASGLGLKDWCLAAGFVRNLVWDRLHGYRQSTPLDDIDLVYFDSNHPTGDRDRALEARLKANSTFPWSVKNQARMHLRNNDPAYSNTAEAMSYWVEIETAIGARLSTDGRHIEFVAPFGLAPLFAGTLTPNPKRPGREAFMARVEGKAWLSKWPRLVLRT